MKTTINTPLLLPKVPKTYTLSQIESRPGVYKSANGDPTWRLVVTGKPDTRVVLFVSKGLPDHIVERADKSAFELVTFVEDSDAITITFEN